MNWEKNLLSFLAVLMLCGSAVAQDVSRSDLSKRDFQYLEQLKQELAKAEDMPGGLEYARQLKRQIATIEKGTDIYTPHIGQAQPALPQQARAIPQPAPVAPKVHHGPVTLTETRAGEDLDLFHDRTITVGEEYGVPRDVVQSAIRKKQQAAIQVYKPLSLPGEGGLESPASLASKSAMQAPLYGAPVSGMRQQMPQRAAPQPKKPSMVDAMRFSSPKTALYGAPSEDVVMGSRPAMQAPQVMKSPTPKPQQSLYGTPPGYRAAHQGSVVPSTYAPMQAKQPVAWKMDKTEAIYLEDKLRTKLAQLAHARRQLSNCDGQQADAWTSRIYDLETEKRSLLRMLKALGVTPSFTKVSMSEDPEFDTVQSEDYLLKRQLHETEKQEKKLRRQLKFSNDPEVMTNAGERLAMVERNRKLLESSLQNLQKNKANVDRTSVVERPRIYRAPEPETPKKEEAKPVEPVAHQEAVKPQMVTSPPVAGSYKVQRPAVQKFPAKVPMPVMLPHKSTSPVIDVDEDDDDDDCMHTPGSFWSSSMPPLSANTMPHPDVPKRVDLEEAQVISATWGDE